MGDSEQRQAGPIRSLSDEREEGSAQGKAQGVALLSLGEATQPFDGIERRSGPVQRREGRGDDEEGGGRAVYGNGARLMMGEAGRGREVVGK